MSCDPLQQLGVALISLAIGAGWALWAAYFLSGAERRDGGRRKREQQTDKQ